MDLAKILGALIPAQTVMVGGKPTKSSGVPVDVKLAIDPEFKKTLITVVGILSVGIGAGIATGIVISKARKRT